MYAMDDECNGTCENVERTKTKIKISHKHKWLDIRINSI